MKYPSIYGLSLLTVSGLISSCDEAPQQKNEQSEKTMTSDSNLPNIVLIVSDDHGRNDAGCYGNEAIKTPNLDYLASEGIRFTNAYCTSASCTASRSVILSGLYNHANGLYGHMHGFHHFRAFNTVTALPEFLAEEAGYTTARIGKYHLAPEHVFPFDTVLPESGNLRNDVQMADDCKNFIETNKDKPFFLYFCTSDPHRGGGKVEDSPLPYKPDRFGNTPEGYPGVNKVQFHPDSIKVPPYLPDTPASRAELAQYYQSVARMDLGFGRLFQHLKEQEQWDNSLIIYISDNGIAFPGAKTNLYDPGMHLPCIVKLPQSKNKGSTSRAMINWADLTPTILDFAGINPNEKLLEKYIPEDRTWDDPPAIKKFHGRSFKKVLHNPTQTTGWDTTYASHTFHEITMYYPMRVIVTRKYKLIWNIASGLAYPHASDLWESATWQSVIHSNKKMYAYKPVDYYTHRPEFELFDMQNDPQESTNLAGNPEYADELAEMKIALRKFQEKTNDPWVVKWKHE